MAAIPINLTIPANKNLDDEALNAFLLVHPNETANPASRFFVPANPPSQPEDGVDDEEWMKIWTQGQLNDTINVGIERGFQIENQPPAFDPDIVE